MTHQTKRYASAVLQDPLVMVMDDDALTQELLQEMLRDLGITRLLTADDGRQALKRLASLPHAPEFLICDIFMPEMDGFEFLEQLSAKHYAGGVVMMTGVDPEMLRMARDIAVVNGLHVLGTFLKPISMAQLAEALTA